MSKLVAAMIVKNEGHILRRCFDSIKPYVDHIIVNDNGSTDDTQKILDEYNCIQVPSNWVDFATNRNLVLNVARQWGDYILCGIDADEVLCMNGLQFPSFWADAYNIMLHLPPLIYPRVAIVKSTTPWYWRGVVQEGLYCDGGPTTVVGIEGIHIQSYRDGARSKDPKTQENDLDVLVRAAEKSGYKDPRLVFYTAQQYKDMRQYDKAIHWYNIRINLEGYKEEVWMSHYMLARIKEWQGGDPVRDYLEVYEMDPRRAEPLYYAAEWCRQRGKYHMATMMACIAGSIKATKEALFIDADVYDWAVYDVIASAAWYTPMRELGEEAAKLLLKEQRFPEQHRGRIEANLKFYTGAKNG